MITRYFDNCIQKQANKCL